VVKMTTDMFPVLSPFMTSPGLYLK